jgi:hypothetical protein
MIPINKNVNQDFPKQILSPQEIIPPNAVLIYCLFSVLFDMKDELGVKTVFECLGVYLEKIKLDDSAIYCAASQVIDKDTVERIYQEAMNDEIGTK